MNFSCLLWIVNSYLAILQKRRAQDINVDDTDCTKLDNKVAHSNSHTELDATID
jgi:hypothetical protein